MLIRTNKGFTLIELMVAISIFAIVSLLTMGGLSNVLNTQKHTEDHLQRLTQFQMAFMILSRELQQFSNRSVRDEYGAMFPSISHETSEGIDGIEFTHHGRFTFGEQLSLQRVAYYLEDKRMIKKTWSVLDRVEDSKPHKQVVLDNVEALKFSFYTKQSSSEGQWQDDLTDIDNRQLSAVKLSIKTEDFDELYRIFEVLP